MISRPALPGSDAPTSSWPALSIYCAHAPPVAVNAASGGIGGLTCALFTCPLDVIKTRLQNQHRNPVPGMSIIPRGGITNTARSIIQSDGIARGLYRGLGPMMLGYVPTWGVYMSVYHGSREYLYGKIENKTVVRICASVIAGTCATTLTNPIWVIKTRFMAQSGHCHPHQANNATATEMPYYRSTLDAARRMYKSEGIGVFYSGLVPALLGLSHVAIQFPAYDYLKTAFTGVEMGQDALEPGGYYYVGMLAAIFLSKLTASVVTYPHEVLRTRLQTQVHCASEEYDSVKDSGRGNGRGNGRARPPKTVGMVELVRSVVRNEGWQALYAGMGTNLVRAVPAAVTMMVPFEVAKSTIERLRDEGRALSEC